LETAIVRHMWGLASALGLLIAVIFGTWACLTASTDDPSTSTSGLLALGGALLMGIGVVARGQGSAAVAKVRRAIGGLGLVVAPVAGVLALLALATDPSAAAGFLVVTVVALAAWAQGVAAQVGLSFRVSFAWLATLALIAAVIMVVGVVLGAFVAGAVSLLVGGQGSDAGAGMNVGYLVVLALIVAVFTVWAYGRPDRLAVPKALGRAALGRGGPDDVEVLAAGPGPILRRRSVVGADRAAADARLAAADARLGDQDEGHSDQT
jgi:hypothetical protein